MHFAAEHAGIGAAFADDHQVVNLDGLDRETQAVVLARSRGFVGPYGTEAILAVLAGVQAVAFSPAPARWSKPTSRSSRRSSRPRRSDGCRCSRPPARRPSQPDGPRRCSTRPSKRSRPSEGRVRSARRARGLPGARPRPARAPRPGREPLVLISQIQRSGGTLLCQLFDGHPECHVDPYELKIGHPKKHNWPPLDLSRPETLVRDALLPRHRRAPPPHRADAPPGRGPRRLPVPLPRRGSRRRSSTRASRRGRPRANATCSTAYFTSYFNAWLDNQNLYTGPKRAVVGLHAPPRDGRRRTSSASSPPTPTGR